MFISVYLSSNQVNNWKFNLYEKNLIMKKVNSAAFSALNWFNGVFLQIKKIMKANDKILSDADPNFYLK